MTDRGGIKTTWLLRGHVCPHCAVEIALSDRPTLVALDAPVESGIVRSELWHEHCAFEAYPMRVFTARELEAGALIRAGYSVAAISQETGLSPETVKHRLRRMRRRIGATNRMGIVRYFRKAEAKASEAA